MGNTKDFELQLNRDGLVHRVKFQFDLDLYSHQQIFGCIAYNRLYEAGTSNLLVQALQPGDWFIDVGAHIGYFSMLASRLVGTGGRVYSFEPEERNYQRLLDHLQINQMVNVLPHRWAVGAAAGVVDLYTDPANDGGHAVWNVARRMPEKDRAGVTRQPTFITSLDALLASVSGQPIKAIKIDTEGFELEVLKGMTQLLDSKRVSMIIVEINRSVLSHLNVTEQHIRRVFDQRGYRAFVEEPESGRILSLKPGEEFQSQFVFNMIFARPEIITSVPLLSGL